MRSLSIIGDDSGGGKGAEEELSVHKNFAFKYDVVKINNIFILFLDDKELYIYIYIYIYI